jgi:hypothetical protein
VYLTTASQRISTISPPPLEVATPTTSQTNTITQLGIDEEKQRIQEQIRMSTSSVSQSDEDKFKEYVNRLYLLYTGTASFSTLITYTLL